MKFFKKFTVLFLSISTALMLLLVFDYFRKPDIKTTAAKAAENLEQIDSYSNLTSLNISFESSSDYPIELSLSAMMSSDVSVTSASSHSKETLNFSMNQLPYQVTMEFYDVIEDDGPVTYIQSNNTWSKQNGTSFPNFDFSSLHKLFDKIADGSMSIEFHSGSEKIDGQKTLSFDVNVSGDFLKNAIQAHTSSIMTSDNTFLDSIDWENISCNFHICLYKDSLLPALVKLSSSDIANAISGNIFPENTEKTMKNVTVKDFSLEIAFRNYNAEMNISVPKSITSVAETSVNGDTELSDILEILGLTGEDNADLDYSVLNPNPDGSYTIASPDTEARMNIKVPEFISANISADSTSIYAANEDFSYSYVYFFGGENFANLESCITVLSDMSRFETRAYEMIHSLSVFNIKKDSDYSIITYTYRIPEYDAFKSNCYIVTPIDTDLFIIWIERDQNAPISMDEIETAIESLSFIS